MHPQSKQTIKLRRSYNQGEESGRNRTEGAAKINVKMLAQMPARASICA